MSEQMRCPERACTGWVCEIEESTDVYFFGCGACGNVWRSEQELAKAIEHSVKSYPYRSQAYMWNGKSWTDNPSGSLASDYEEKVAAEWGDEG